MTVDGGRPHPYPVRVSGYTGGEESSLFVVGPQRVQVRSNASGRGFSSSGGGGGGIAQSREATHNFHARQSGNSASTAAKAKARATTVRSLASGSINPPNPAAAAAAACGIGSTLWWNGRNPIDGDNNIRNPPREEFQIQDYIINLSNTNLPLTKSMTCNNTCNKTANDDSSDEENHMPLAAANPKPLIVGRSHQHNINNNMEYSPYGRSEEGMVLLDTGSMDNNRRSHHRSHGRDDIIIPRTFRRKQDAPQYIYHPVEDTADEMSSLAATAANEILDCMDASPLVAALAPNMHYPAHGTRQRSMGRQRQSSLSSCTNFLAIEVPLSKSPHMSNGKTLMRGMCSHDVTIDDNTQHTLCTHDTSTSLSIPRKGQREIDYWKQRLSQARRYNEAIQQAAGKRSSASTISTQEADLYFNLGQAYMKSSQYEMAVQQFVTAMNAWKSKHGPHHITIGRSMDAIGLAMMRQAQPSSKDGLLDAALMKKAQRHLHRAFTIRFHHLGVWHVDTVETYNKLASVHLHLGELHEAGQAYQQVFLVRRAIFGRQHPSVAISAHSLANVFYKLNRKQESLQWYDVAQSIYEDDLQLSHQHPTVAKLLKDRARLER